MMKMSQRIGCHYPKSQRNSMDIQELIEIFSTHAEKYKKNQDELVKKFQENNPGEPLGQLEDTFNLPEALAFMCKEIAKFHEIHKK